MCIVDADRNAVSITTTVNYPFGGGVLSPSTGIVLNNEMDDFSTPTEDRPDKLPPAPTNFIKPNKRPLSSMTPLIVVKVKKYHQAGCFTYVRMLSFALTSLGIFPRQDNQLVGALGGSGGMDIIPAVTQVFMNSFILGLEPLAAVQNPRVYHRVNLRFISIRRHHVFFFVFVKETVISPNLNPVQLIPNVVLYENWTVIDGDHIELPDERKLFLEKRGHQLQARSGGAIVQLVVQTFQKDQNPINMGRKHGKDSNADIFHGKLTAVCDPRKNGRPAAI